MEQLNGMLLTLGVIQIIGLLIVVLILSLMKNIAEKMKELNTSNMKLAEFLFDRWEEEI